MKNDEQEFLMQRRLKFYVCVQKWKNGKEVYYTNYGTFSESFLMALVLTAPNGLQYPAHLMIETDYLPENILFMQCYVRELNRMEYLVYNHWLFNAYQK